MWVGRRILRTALIAGSALELLAGGSVLALASGPAAQASTASADCPGRHPASPSAEHRPAR